MQRLAMVLVLAWLAVVGSTPPARAYFLDTPHNESNGIYCYTCHAMTCWTNPPSGGADVTMRNAVCLQCHGEGASDPHKGPSKKPHASSTTSTEKGTWSTECTQCHDVHSQGQLDWSTTDAAGLYLAWGTLSSSGSYLARDLVDSPVYGSTTFNIIGVAGQTGWTDTTTWVGKGGRVDKGRATDGSRGLVFVPNRANPNETYEIIGALPSSLKVKGRVATSGLLGKSFGVIYGQSLKSAILPNGGTTAEAMRNVKLFQPGIMAGTYGGYIDESGSAEPQGLCQVCHDRTVYWKNDGSSTEHNSSNVCGECHNILTGLAGSADHRLFIGDRLGTGCGNCHASEVSAPESGHSGGCYTCHADPKPAINSNPLGNEGGISVLAALNNGGYSFGPRLTDGGGHGINDAGFVVVDCSECHELKRSGVQGGTHGGHDATAFGWDSNCVDCHGPSSKDVARDVHGNLCATCHDPARVAVNDYTVRIEGSSANGIDGSAVGATRLSRCSGCHNTNTPGVVHHTSKNGYAAGGNCAFCHATSGHQGNHTELVGGYVNCVNCHSANLGSGAGAPVDPIDPKKHDACTTCHNFNTALKTLAQVNTLKVVAMPDGGAGSTNGGGSCLSCHGEYFGNHLQANHLAKVAGHQGCDSCHPGTAGTATTVPTSATDNKLHDDCYTCHQATGALKAGYGKASGMVAPGGDCTSCHGVYFPNHQINHAARVAGTSNCTDCHTGTAGTATTIPVNASDNKVHDACATCHDDQSTNLLKAPYGKASAMPAGGGDCNACHGAYFASHDTNLAHDHRVTSGLTTDCTSCHVVGSATAIDALHINCQTCHEYSGNRLDPVTVAAVIVAGRGVGGSNQNCEACHTSNLHHATREAVNNSCATTCHPAVDHSSRVAGNAACVNCHTGTAGSATGIPVSFGDAEIHDTCRTCHAFDSQGRGTLVDFTNQKGVNGSGPLPAGGGDCTVCHAVFTASPTSAIMASFHHTSPRTAVGQCETCHPDPRPGWQPSVAPGDNGTASGLSRPTQMACLKCHVTFSAGSMTVTRFTRSNYTSYHDDWTRSTAHTIPVTSGRINNYGICLNCHYQGSAKVPASAQLSVWHANPSRYGGSAWTFNDVDILSSTGKTYLRNSQSYPAGGDRARYAPGRSRSFADRNAPQSGISGFNIFAPNYGFVMTGYFETTPAQSDYDYRLPPDMSSYNGPAPETPALTRIAPPTVAQIGSPTSATLNATTRAVPVFASLAPLTAESPTPDQVRILSASYSGEALTVLATTSNSGGCATLTARYNGHDQPFTGTTICTANFPSTVVYTSSVPTLDVITSNASGLDVIGYGISESLNPKPDTTSPVAMAVTATPEAGSFVPASFGLTTQFVDDESAVTSCAYTTDGTTWTSVGLSGSTPVYTCTADLSGMSGPLTLNMRATSTGGMGTAIAIARSVDVIPPVDGVLTVAADFGQNSLAWNAATDGGSGLRTANTYDVRFQTGSTPPTCSSGSSLSQGTARSYTHTGLTNGTQYSYRVCAYDKLDNVSTGATGSATPHDITPPDAGEVVATPNSGSYVPATFTLTTIFTDTQTPVTSCDFTTNGTTWAPGVVSGSSPSYTCTANPSAMSGALVLNMRATSSGGLRTASPMSKTVDRTSPTDGGLSVSPYCYGSCQNSLTWLAATDSQSGLRTSNTYDVRFLTGATAPTCTTGTSLYLGTLLTYTHTGLTVATPYSYRVCAYDNLNNVSAGVTGSGTPPITAPILASPTATNIGAALATLGANVTEDGGTPVTARGTVWGTSAIPTTNQSVEGGQTTGTFTQERTGLPAGTKVYYRGYATNSVGTAYSPAGSFYTEPVTQASGVSFTAVGATGMTVNWVRGDGDGVIVLMKRGAPVDVDPPDGTTQYASSIFTYGNEFGPAGSHAWNTFVMYCGTGTSVAVTGLTSGATYYVAVYEYKGTINTVGVDQGINYKAIAAVGSQTAVATITPTLASPIATPSGTTATLGANLTGGGNITSRGTVWGIAASPTGNLLAEGGTGTGAFSHLRTGLPAGTKIYYRGYATNAVGTGYSPDGSFYTEPATGASGVSFSPPVSFGIPVNWTRGDGDGVIVLMKQGSAVNAAPVDGTYSGYTANSTFGSGTQIGSGNYVVYKGADTSVLVTGLTNNATYYLAVYEYKGSGDTSGADQGTNYLPTAATGSQTACLIPLLASPTATAISSSTATLGATVTADGGAPITARGTVWGLSTSPTTNPLAEGGTAITSFSHGRTGLSSATKIYYRGYATNSLGTGYSPTGSFFTEPDMAIGRGFSPGLTNMTLYWTRGNGDGVIVVMRQGSDLTAEPIDGNYTGYAANPVFGGGSQLGSGNYVVYKGTDTSITVTGLTLATTYTYAVYEYKGTVDTSGMDLGTNYAGAVEYSYSTGYIPPTITSPIATAIGSTTATLGATVTDTGTELVARATVWDTSASPTRNAMIEQWTTTGSFSQDRTELPAATKIYYRGAAFYPNQGSTYSATGSFYTEPAVPASGVNFTGSGGTGMTINWTRGDGDGVIVLMRNGSVVDGVPVDGTYTGYTANSTFGSGSQIGSGNYVVYQGSGSSVTITGLTGGNNYYVAVYEYKGSVDTSGDNQGTNYTPTSATGSNSVSVAVALGSAFESKLVMAGGTSPTLELPAYTVPAGGNRLLMVALHYEPLNPSDVIGITATYGVANFTQVQRIDNVHERVWVGYLPEAEIAANQNQPLRVSVTGTVGSVALTAGSFVNVNQAQPVFASTQTANYEAYAIPLVGSPGVPVVNSGLALYFGTVDQAIITESPYDYTELYDQQATSGSVFTYSGGYKPITGDGYSYGELYFNHANVMSGVVTVSLNPVNSEPTVPASGVSFTEAGASNMTVNWNRGSGDGVIVLMREGAPVDVDPVDGSVYPADPTFGVGSQVGSGNYVVYQGSGGSVVVTGLTVGNTYYVAVYEYRGCNYLPTAATGSNFVQAQVEPIGVGNPFQTMLGIPGGTYPPVVEIQSGSYSVPPGADRLLLVVLHYEALDPLVSIPIYADYGYGNSLIEVQRIDSGYERVWVGYLPESGIALGQNQPLYVWIEGNVGTAVFTAGSFTNVNQFQPIFDARQAASSIPQQFFEFSGAPEQGPPLMAVNGGRAVYFGTYDNAATTQEPPPDFTELYDRHTGGGTMFTFSSADKLITADGPLAGIISLSSPQPYGVVSVSLRP